MLFGGMGSRGGAQKARHTHCCRLWGAGSTAQRGGAARQDRPVREISSPNLSTRAANMRRRAALLVLACCLAAGEGRPQARCCPGAGRGASCCLLAAPRCSMPLVQRAGRRGAAAVRLGRTDLGAPLQAPARHLWALHAISDRASAWSLEAAAAPNAPVAPRCLGLVPADPGPLGRQLGLEGRPVAAQQPWPRHCRRRRQRPRFPRPQHCRCARPPRRAGAPAGRGSTGECQCTVATQR